MQPELVTPKFRVYGEDEAKFYLSKGVVTENGKPKTSITWLDAFKYLASQGVGISNLAQTLYAASKDQEIHDSVYKFPAEWKQLIQNPNTKSESSDYVLLDAQGNPIKKTGKYARSILPISVTEDNGRQVIMAEAHDIPFKLKDSKYNLEDIDLTTGFLTKLDPNGKYGIWFSDYEGVYAVFLVWDGGVHCDWGPGSSYDRVGFRGGSTGNIPQELIESEKLVLQEKIDLQTAKLRKAEEKIDKVEEEVAKLEVRRGELANDYKSSLEQLKDMQKKLESL